MKNSSVGWLTRIASTLAAGVATPAHPRDPVLPLRGVRDRLAIAAFFLLPLAARANPVQVDGVSALAFGIVAFWALVIESGLVTLSLVPCGVNILPSFFTLVVGNVSLFVFAFLPLTGRVSLWSLESAIVCADAVLI